MEKREIERADLKSNDSYAHRFLKRLKEAEARGFKYSGPITEKELRAFETGTSSKVEQTSRLKYSDEERERIWKQVKETARELAFFETEEDIRARRIRMDDKTRELTYKLKLSSMGLGFMENTDPKSEIYLR